MLYYKGRSCRESLDRRWGLLLVYIYSYRKINHMSINMKLSDPSFIQQTRGKQAEAFCKYCFALHVISDKAQVSLPVA